MTDEKKKIDQAIDKLNKGMDAAIESVKDWITDLVIADDRPPDWKIDFHVLTPEEETKSQAKLNAALKRWEERKAAERHEKPGGENDGKDKR